ncbi:MAG: electron transfer flavoprotein subunit alpha/FixB family protein, partial [Parapedobacter sp.]
MSVLVYTENNNGSFKKSVYEVVSYAKALADSLNTSLTAISIGNVDQPALASLGNYGASRVLDVSNDQLKQFINQAYASVIAEAANYVEADLIVISNSFSGKGLAPRVAAKLQAGLADGAVELPQIDGDKITVKKTAFSGKAFALTELTSAKKVIALPPVSR